MEELSIIMLCGFHAKTIDKLPWVHLHLLQTYAGEVARTPIGTDNWDV
jgi:hypothetical protein